jgi:predicted nucleic acid-binding protein
MTGYRQPRREWPAAIVSGAMRTSPGEGDAQIAAIARFVGAGIATRNSADWDGCGGDRTGSLPICPEKTYPGGL